MNKQGDKNMKEAKCLLCKLPGAKVTDHIESNVGLRIGQERCQGRKGVRALTIELREGLF